MINYSECCAPRKFNSQTILQTASLADGADCLCFRCEQTRVRASKREKLRHKLRADANQLFRKMRKLNAFNLEEAPLRAQIKKRWEVKLELREKLIDQFYHSGLGYWKN